MALRLQMKTTHKAVVITKIFAVFVKLKSLCTSCDPAIIAAYARTAWTNCEVARKTVQCAEVT